MADTAYPLSRYAARLGEIPASDGLRGTVSADVCVVGAGLSGLTTALELIKLGKSVVLLESGRVAIGASGRNGGFVSAGFAQSMGKIEKRIGLAGAQKLYALSQGGADYVHRMITGSASRSIIEGEGKLVVRRTNRVAALRQETATFNQKYQQDLQVWNRAELADLLQTDRYFAATHDAGGFHIDPLRYALLLRQLFAEGGGILFEQTAAIRLAREPAGWQVHTPHGIVDCADVALCQNLDADRLYPKLAGAVLPVATYVVAAVPGREVMDTAINFSGSIADDRRAGDYYRRVDDGLIWGGRITTRRSQPARLASLMHRDILGVYPQLDGLEIAQCWMGLMGYTVHLMPIIGELEPGLWAATGFGGHGLNTTAMAGNLIAAGIADEDDSWRLFDAYRVRWGGGVIGRVGTQAAYWWMQWRDRREEASAERTQPV